VVVVALALAFALVATGCADSRGEGGTPPAASSTLSQAPNATNCNSQHPANIVHLGDGPHGALVGNSAPVKATIRSGSVIEVLARFGQRALTFPATSSSVLAASCRNKDGWTYASYFRAVEPGAATVIAQTATCGACIQLGFSARIVVQGT
jgi:hypothetical protein